MLKMRKVETDFQKCMKRIKEQQKSLREGQRALTEKQASLEERENKLRADQEKWEAAAVNLDKTQVPSRVKLDIGGQIFATTLDTLTTIKGTFFDAMFSGRFPAKLTADGCYFIDRDPHIFRHILNYLRGQSPASVVEKLPSHEREELYLEAGFYLLDGLVELLAPLSLSGPLDLRWRTGVGHTVSADGKTVTSTDGASLYRPYGEVHVITQAIDRETMWTVKYPARGRDSVGIVPAAGGEAKNVYGYHFGSSELSSPRHCSSCDYYMPHMKNQITIKFCPQEGKLFMGKDADSLELVFEDIPQDIPMAAYASLVGETSVTIM